MKLIDKSALVAEIEKRLNYRIESLKTINNGTFWKEGQSEDEFNESLTRCAFNAAKNELFELKCFLDTLEVKEVDLEKEIEKCLKQHNMLAVGRKDFTEIAKHFFELVLRVNNPITAADRGTAEEIIINLKRVEKDYRIDLTKEIEWVRNQVKKGEDV